jgi:hypothetical protein
LSACAHATRVVCANTHHISEAQGIANGTHRKARHTKNADKKVVEFLIELAALQKVLSSHKEALDHLVDMQMSKRDVDCFLGNMFPIAEDDSEKTGTTRENKQDEIKEIFETCEDLQGPIQGTRYAMFQSVTNYSQYKNVKRGTDRAGAWYDAAAFGGSRQKFNQKAFDLLMDDVIPECPTRLSVMA